jgi:hypothetical protein
MSIEHKTIDCQNLQSYISTKVRDGLMFIPCISRRSKNVQHMHWIVPLLYSIYRLLHVSAVDCHHQGASWIRLSYLKFQGNSNESKNLPDVGRPLPKHVGACILNKGVVQFSACVGCFYYVRWCAVRTLNQHLRYFVYTLFILFITTFFLCFTYI